MCDTYNIHVMLSFKQDENWWIREMKGNMKESVFGGVQEIF